MLKKTTALLVPALLLAGCGQEPECSHVRKCDNLQIVSMAPNVTEILYALELEDQIIGVSSYSTYPPDAKNKPQVGGTYDPNWEQIVSLHPDLVIGLDSQEEIAGQLRQLGIDFLGVPHERVREIMQSVLTIGEACGAKEKAQQIFQQLEQQIRNVPNIGKSNPPKILVCIGHDEQLTRMYIAARNTFYDDLITLAGGTNACEQTAIKYPEISPESLRAMQPDLIIDLIPGTAPRHALPPDAFSKAWNPYNAVLLTNDYAFIPGPRFGLLLNDFVREIYECSHPDQ